MAQVQYDLSKAQALEFTVKSEPWVKYKLEDKSVLFARFVMLKTYRTSEYDANGQPIYGWGSQNLVTINAPAEKKRPPSQPLPTSMNPADYDVTPLDFERVGPELWNVYELSDGSLVRVKLEIMGVTRTDKYSADGEPFYIVANGPISRVKVPPHLLRKQNPPTVQKVDVYR